MKRINDHINPIFFCRWQQNLFDRVLIKLTTRIRNTYRSKEEKQNMVEIIAKRVQKVKLDQSVVGIKNIFYKFIDPLYRIRSLAHCVTNGPQMAPRLKCKLVQ